VTPAPQQLNFGRAPVLARKGEAAKRRVAIICDYPEEGWPSMDFVGQMLFEHLSCGHSDAFEVDRIRPRFVRRFSHMPLGSSRIAFNADRLLNRFWYYPRALRERSARFDIFHIVDHGYAQLANELPSERTVVTCHDLGAFRCLLEPESEPRSRLFRAFAERILAGLRRAAKVICVSRATGDEMLSYGLVDADRIVMIPNGVHPVCSPIPDRLADAEASCLLGRPDSDAPLVLHVGSNVPRKRNDLLLQIFADLKKRFPKARLIQAGGAFTRDQAKLVAQLNLEKAVQVLPFLSAPILAAVYRRASLVLLTSEREGFGLPVIEAMACGTPVAASDIPVLREVGGDAATYCPVGDVIEWTEAASALLRERNDHTEQWQARRNAGLAWASRFSWAEHARAVLALYEDLLA
jgi:glycosyltransferase involved in cell wall biosynthesis